MEIIHPLVTPFVEREKKSAFQEFNKEQKEETADRHFSYRTHLILPKAKRQQEIELRRKCKYVKKNRRLRKGKGGKLGIKRDTFLVYAFQS